MFCHLDGSACNKRFVQSVKAPTRHVSFPGGEGVLLEFLVGRCAARFSDCPISDPKMSFFTPALRPSLKKIMSQTLRLKHQQKRLLKIHSEFAHFSFFLIHLNFKRYIRSYFLRSP